MKKLITLFLALAMIFSLCACGGGNTAIDPEETALTKEKMLEQATEVEAVVINNDSHDNLANAKQQFCNKVLQVTGQIQNITDDHIEVGTPDFVVDVYLPTDELIALKVKQKVVIVGQTNDTLEKTSQSVGGNTLETSHYKMPQAYLVQDHFEVKGVIQTSGIKINGSNGIKSVHWAEGVDKEAYAWQEVTISAICIEENGGWVYYDATIVE